MKIAILNLTAGGISPGYFKYLENIIPRFAQNPNVGGLLCAAPPGTFLEKGIPFHQKIRYVTCRPYNTFVYRDPKLTSELNQFAPDIIFIPTARYFQFRNTPVVSMIQNMYPFVTFNGKNSYEKILHFIDRRIAISALKKSSAVVAISRFVKKYLTSNRLIPKHRIKVIYHGIEANDEVTSEKPLSIPDFKREDFFLTAGSITPYRGIEDIIDALKLISATGIRPNLIIAGGTARRFTKYKRKLERDIDNLGLTHSVIWAGNLKKKELLWCYRNCKIFLMTSKVEACPNVALEAMASGCRIVSTKHSPMPEIFQDCAQYYDPKKGLSLYSQILHLLQSPGYAEKMTQKARRRASEFSWEICAEKLVALFQGLLTP